MPHEGRQQVDSQELLREVEGGEGQTLEFKQGLSQVDEGLEALCGMINAEPAHGAVWFGVGDDGSLVEIEEGNLDGAQKKLFQKTQKFDPPIRPTVQVPEGKRLIRLSATRERGTPYHEYDGRAFIRVGAVTRRLSLSEKEALSRRRGRDRYTGPWKCDKCGSIVGQLLGMEVTDQGVARSYSCKCGGEYWPIV
jgi:predicted HTH transcriptional regulator